MTETTKTIVTRTVTLGDLTPAEAASIFAEWDSRQQAAFFGHIAEEAMGWPGTGWMMQALYIADHLSDEGKRIVQELAESIRHD